LARAKKVRYQPFYCEENVWWLCKDGGGQAVFISNQSRQCLMFHQRAAPPGELVVWDYHVIQIVDGCVNDLDTRLGISVPVADYTAATFPKLPAELSHLAPSFRVVEASEFLERFTTTRSHMRGDTGAWLQAPPPWDPPRVDDQEHNLSRFIDMSDNIAGAVVDLAGLLQSSR
jgi:hypothetical protein